ncbi:hypothetical protein cypCar_00038244, partial [Cyprinus carpio]
WVFYFTGAKTKLSQDVREKDVIESQASSEGTI